MRFVSYLAGVGGFHLAAKKLSGKCALACEIDDKLQKNYEPNFEFKILREI